MEGYVSVAVFATEVDAELAQATLAAAGIESFVQSDEGRQTVFVPLRSIVNETYTSYFSKA